MKSLSERSDRILAQCNTGTNSKRPSNFPNNYPTHIVKQEGCYVFDHTGKRYIDFIGALGATILGYNQPVITEAIRTQLESGYISGSLPHHLEIEVAEKICAMFPVKRVRFVKTGSEACSAAVRIARSSSSGRYIYSDGYHGWHDGFTSLTEPAKGVKDQFYFKPLRKYDINWPSAAIIEPVALDISPQRKEEINAYWKQIRQKNGYMIFDEIITGLRFPKYSVAKCWDMTPDIMLLGKAMAGGLPLGVIAGQEDIMNQPDYFVSGTFSGEALSLAACRATLDEIRKRSIDDLFYYANRFMENLNKLHPNIKFTGYGTRAMLNITTRDSALFAQECCNAGILFGKAFFYHFGHMESNIDEMVLNICTDIAQKIKRGEVRYHGRLPTETFHR